MMLAHARPVPFRVLPFRVEPQKTGGRRQDGTAIGTFRLRPTARESPDLEHVFLRAARRVDGADLAPGPTLHRRTSRRSQVFVVRRCGGRTYARRTRTRERL